MFQSQTLYYMLVIERIVENYFTSEIRKDLVTLMA